MKKITALLSMLLLLIPVQLQSQRQAGPPPPPPPPPPKGAVRMSKADSLLRDGSVKASIAEYKRAYLANSNNRSFIYNYACALSLGGQADSSIRYLYIVSKLEPLADVLIEPDLLSARESKDWEVFENELITAINMKTGNSVKDIPAARKLWKLFCIDQSGFYFTGIAVRKLGPDSPVVGALRRLQDLQNEKNLAELRVMLDTKGWPEKSQVGPEASAAAFFILQHSNAEDQEKYIGMFETACRKNEAEWQQYALMFDRMRMNQNKPQRYGTHTYLDPEAGPVNELYPLEDDTKVEEWRKEIGLEPLKEYLARTNIKYKPVQAKK